MGRASAEGELEATGDGLYNTFGPEDHSERDVVSPNNWLESAGAA